MFASRAVRGVASFILISISIASCAQSRDEAVRKAREGRTEEAIVELRQIVTSNPEDKEAAMDLAVVLTWAHRPREATDTFERAGANEPPEFVLLAMARAYRDQQRFAEAQRLTREGLRRFPEAQSFALLEDLLVGDTALAVGDNFTALRAYAQALQRSPDEADIAVVVSRILIDLKAPYAAAAYTPNPDLGVASRQAAEMVNWGGTIVPPDPRKRFDQTDAAIAKLDELIKEASEQNPPDRELVLRLRRDRVLALHNRERCTEAEEEASAIRTTGDKLPPFVRAAEAGCLLALRRPQEAAGAYQDVLAADPADKVARQGLFYAYIEQENFNAAFAIADQSLLEQEPVIRRVGSPTPIANWHWLDAQVNSALARHFAGMEAAAWSRLVPFAQGAPALSHLRDAQGSVAAARGWPRLAEEETQIALTLEPENLGTQVALADSALRRNRFEEAERMAGELSSLFPQDPGVGRLQREVDAARAPEFRLETGGSSQNGNAVDSPGSGYAIIARLYSSLLMERWRVFAAYDYLREQPVEGVIRRIRYGVGAEARWSDFTLEAVAWDNTGTLSRGGATLAASWQASDHLSFSADGALYAIDTPLRATFYGITASGGGFRTNYAWNESMAISGGIRALSFTDGNQRLEGNVSFQRRFIDRPRLIVSMQPELYLSRNTAKDAPYFNPPHDGTFGVAVTCEHILWRRYERSLFQQLRVGASAYWQMNFPTNWLGDVTYQQVLRFERKWDLRYGGGVSRRVYDGRAVRNLEGLVTLETRF
jgi:biofilm PGA synthesis protein PgaA